MVFRGKVKEGEGGYKLVLDRGALGSSCRFTRRFGSKCFIRVKVDKSLYYDPNNRLSDFFQHRFILWGHVFRACYAKDDNVFLIKVNETMLADGSIAKTEGPSLDDFINWFNPLDKNQKQASWTFPASRYESSHLPSPCQNGQQGSRWGFQTRYRALKYHLQRSIMKTIYVRFNFDSSKYLR